MIDFLQMSKDACVLGDGLLKSSFALGAFLGFAITCLFTCDVFQESDHIAYGVKYYTEGAVKSIACFVVCTLVFTACTYFILGYAKPALTKQGGIEAVKEEALKNEVDNLDDLKFNIDYLLNKYEEESDKLNYRNTLNYSLDTAKNNSLPKLDDSDYANSILNKFYIDKEIAENVALLIDGTNLEYDKVYKELKK